MKKMRRKDRATDPAEAIRLLTDGEYGVLSTVDETGQPYGVPLNYVYKDNTLYFHSAVSGHKIDNLKTNPNVSFCVVGNTKVLPSELSAAYESVVAFGTASETEGEEKNAALLLLVEKYASDYTKEGKQEIEKYGKATKIIKIDIQHITGKASHKEKL